MQRIEYHGNGDVMAAIDDYLDLITPYYRGKPVFTATLTAVLEPFVNLQSMLGKMPQDFDLDTAVGAQLDAVGEWVGRTRFIPTPVANVWFTFNDDRRGFDLGVWKGPYDSDTGITRLDDETYRIFLRAKIAANQWDGRVETAQAAFSLVFSQSPGTNIFVIDNFDMTMTVGISGVIPSLLFIALLQQGFLPIKPEGVRINYAITTVNNAPVFGFSDQVREEILTFTDTDSDDYILTYSNEYGAEFLLTSKDNLSSTPPPFDGIYIGGFDVGSWGVGPEYYSS
ncbi:DUF2612 domain-containing protein [Rhizobium pusense]|uniref:DUF2612 domain-containing protein n=1 Tax=Agrobacterium pusense TaxID=648995 RepID=UPI0024474DF2|nr:DUF2612 domain-containing protein [Agrobacterium pusense]MDH1268921.1 DUF2612 domain-containing protein [Agrobacterium pusense]